MRICTKCKKEKSLACFYKDYKNKTDGRRSVCKGCYYKINPAYSKEYNQKNKKKKEHSTRNSRYKLTYGITIDEYETLLKQQNNLCAICKKGCSTGRRLSVDHCHETNKVRGLLCFHCNMSLGWLEKFRKDWAKYLTHE